jgi:hypothetical protein
MTDHNDTIAAVREQKGEGALFRLMPQGAQDTPEGRVIRRILLCLYKPNESPHRLQSLLQSVPYKHQNDVGALLAWFMYQPDAQMTQHLDDGATIFAQWWSDEVTGHQT